MRVYILCLRKITKVSNSNGDIILPSSLLIHFSKEHAAFFTHTTVRSLAYSLVLKWSSTLFLLLVSLSPLFSISARVIRLRLHPGKFWFRPVGTGTGRRRRQRRRLRRVSYVTRGANRERMVEKIFQPGVSYMYIYIVVSVYSITYTSDILNINCTDFTSNGLSVTHRYFGFFLKWLHNLN